MNERSVSLDVDGNVCAFFSHTTTHSSATSIDVSRGKKNIREGTTRGTSAIGEAVRLIEESVVRSMNLLPVTISTVASGGLNPRSNWIEK